MNSKNKQAENTFYLKNKLNQISVLALPEWQLLCQVSENAILHPIINSYLENYSIHKNINSLIFISIIIK